VSDLRNLGQKIGQNIADFGQKLAKMPKIGYFLTLNFQCYEKIAIRVFPKSRFLAINFGSIFKRQKSAIFTFKILKFII
jgi:hypothetical protein